MASSSGRITLSSLYKKAYDNFEEERELRDIKIKLPEKPPIKEIYNYLESSDKKRKFPYIKLPDEPSDEEMEREWKRRREGLWFFNGKKNNIRLEYVTGYHYMLLQYFPVLLPSGNMGNAFFVDAHRDAYYVWQEVEKSRTIAGLMLFSGRRFSKTTMATNIGYWKTTDGKNRKFGIQSMTFEDAKKTVFQDILIASWKEMHHIWKPADTGNANPTESLVFQAPRKVTKNNKISAYYLGGTIETFTAKTNAMDGKAFTYVYHDEIGKAETGVDPEERYNVVKPTMFVGPQRRGTCMLTTTVDDMEKGAAQGTKRLWDGSDPKKISEKTGTTQTGLLRYFNPADYGYIGSHPITDEPFVDEYGYSNREAAREFIEDQRSELSGAQLISFKRKYPLNEKEIFLSDAEASSFDTASIVEQMDYNEGGAKDIIRRVTFFRDAGSGGTGAVRWREDENGPWFIRDFPAPEDQNKNRPMQEDRTQLEPTRGYFKMGVDPFGSSEVRDKRRASKGAGLILDINHRWVAMYHARPPKIEIFAAQIILAAQFYSCECLVEDNKDFLVGEFRRRGFLGYLMYNPLERDKKKKFKKRGIATTLDKKPEMVQVLASEIYDHIGYNEETEEYGDCAFQALLQEWLDFEAANWTPYDLTVAAMLAVAAWKDQRIDPLSEVQSIGLGKIRKFSTKGNGVTRRIK